MTFGRNLAPEKCGVGESWKWKGKIMVSSNGVVIGSCDELYPGDAIEAFHNGTLVHRGPITETAPEYGLFWILDTLTGARRLLDLSGFTIVRIPAPYREVLVRRP